MFRENYRSMNDKIVPDRELVDKIIGSISMDNRKTGKVKSFFVKPAVISASLLVLILTVTPVLAANIPFIYEFIYFVSPSAAQFFMPLQKSCVNNGIRMEVVSAYIHDNKAEIYISMQDLTGEKRVDKTIDLYDSYSINRPFGSSAFCELVDYDDATGKATFYINITEWGDRKIDGEKITFSVREFISNRHVYDKIPVGVDLSEIDEAPYTKSVSPGGGGGPKYKKYSPDNKSKVKVLVPSEPLEFPVEEVNLTGIGYIDSMLHIQASIENPADFGYFFLKDRNGKEVQCAYSLSFREEMEDGNTVRYLEFVFDVPESEIDGYSLYGTFVTGGTVTRGNWRITFPLEPVKHN